MTSEQALWKAPMGLGEFSAQGSVRQLVPDEAARRVIAKLYGLVSLDRLEAEVKLVRWHDGGQIDGRWSGTVTQNCGVTLEDYSTELKGEFRVRVVPVVGALPAAAAHRAFLVLAWTATVSGNLTLLGAVANVIVAERARAAGAGLSFTDFARAGVPSTVLCLMVGTPIVLALA